MNTDPSEEESEAQPGFKRDALLATEDAFPDATPTAAEPASALLPEKASLALQRLIAHGVVLSRTHEELFNQLIIHRQTVLQILAALGLRAAFESRQGMVALLRVDHATQDTADHALEDAPEDGDEPEQSVSILRKTHLRRFQSIVLVTLRIFFQERQIAGDDRVIIDEEALQSRLLPYWPYLDKEQRSDKNLSGTLKLFRQHGILLPVRGSPDVNEISPVILLAVNAETARTMRDEWVQLAAEHGPNADESKDE